MRVAAAVADRRVLRHLRPGQAAKQDLPAGGRVPLARTKSTVPQDLVNNILRVPQRQRLTLLLNEFGTGLAGRGARPEPGDPRRRARAARDRRRAEPAGQAAPAARRRDAERRPSSSPSSRSAATRSPTSSSRRGDTRRRHRLAQRPAPRRAAEAAELPHRAAHDDGRARRVLDRPDSGGAQARPGRRLRWTTSCGDVVPLAKAAKPGVKSLANTFDKGSSTAKDALPTTQQLNAATKGLPELSTNLRFILEHLDDHSAGLAHDVRAERQLASPGPGGDRYNGLEGLLQFFFDQGQDANMYNANGHFLTLDAIAAGPLHELRRRRCRPQGPGGREAVRRQRLRPVVARHPRPGPRQGRVGLGEGRAGAPDRPGDRDAGGRRRGSGAAVERRPDPVHRLPAGAMRTRPNRGLLTGSPILVGAVTVLVALVAVFLSYNANEGLPFVPTRTLHLELPDGVEPDQGQRGAPRRLPRRLRQVDHLPPGRRADGRRRAARDRRQVRQGPGRLALLRPRAAARSASSTSTSSRASRRTYFAADGTIPVGQSSLPVQIDDVTSTFDDKTRVGVQKTLGGLGDAFAGRGVGINETFGELPDLFPKLTSVMATLRDPNTRLAPFIDSADRLARVLAPVADRQAHLFGAAATTFAAFVADPDSLRDTIDEGARTRGRRDPGAARSRPFLQHAAALGAPIEQSADELRRGAARPRRGGQVGDAREPAHAGVRQAARLDARRRRRPRDRPRHLPRAGRHPGDGQDAAAAAALLRAVHHGLQLLGLLLADRGRRRQRRRTRSASRSTRSSRTRRSSSTASVSRAPSGR